ncbi:hypothetical protein WDW37_21315 [Bdellovibrionota bacterium FG-1]
MTEPRGRIFSLPTLAGGTSDLSNENPEIDALFQAFRQVEATQVRERALASRLKNDLIALQSRHARETAQAQQQLKHYAECYEELRSHFQASQARLQQAQAHAQKLQQAMASQRSNTDDGLKKAQIELQVAKATVDHLRQTNQSLEQALGQIRPDFARSQSDLERAQADALEREHKYQALLMSQRSQEKAYQDTITALKDNLRRTQNETHQYKDRWIDAERIKQNSETSTQHLEELKHKVRDLTEANRELAERQKFFKVRETQDTQTIRELAETRDRLADAEARLSQMSMELARSKVTRVARPSPPPAPRRFSDDTFPMDDLAIMGYPISGELK